MASMGRLFFASQPVAPDRCIGYCLAVPFDLATALHLKLDNP